MQSNTHIHASKVLVGGEKTTTTTNTNILHPFMAMMSFKKYLRT
jgi:hypothetical protein